MFPSLIIRKIESLYSMIIITLCRFRKELFVGRGCKIFLSLRRKYHGYIFIQILNLIVIFGNLIGLIFSLNKKSNYKLTRSVEI